MADADDALRRRNQQLARDLLAALRQPDPPAPQQQPAAGSPAPPPFARTATEMQFAASLLPCPHCGSRAPARLDLAGSGTSWSLAGPCGSCGGRRAHAFTSEGNPNQAACPPRQLGDARPSRAIRPGQLLAELDRLQPQLREPPTGLGPEAWRANLAALERSLTCLYELRKFVPDGMRMIPDHRLEDDERRQLADWRRRTRRDWLQAELDRLLRLRQDFAADAPRIWQLEPPPPERRSAIDRPALDAHARWLRAGRCGDGRLDVAGFDASGLRLAGVAFEAARLERVRFDRALLEAARMREAELREVSAVGAGCQSLDLRRARLWHCTFTGAGLALAVFDDAQVEASGFAGADLDRSCWRGADVRDADFARAVFGNSRLDGGRFRGCSFRNADLRRLVAGIAATTRGAVFEACDLRGAQLDGRDLDGAVLRRCRLHGLRGRPASFADVAIEAPDLSPDGDGSQVGSAADLLAAWR